MRTQKLGIVGVGHVGEHVLAYAANSSLFGEIVTIDTRKEKSFGEALDQAHATGLFTRDNVTIYDGDYEDIADADVIVIAATYVYDDGRVLADRQALMKDNASIIRSIMENITKVTKDAILIFITNPADTVVYIAANEYEYPLERIMSTGCMLDSSRLKFEIGRHYGVDPKSVSAYMMGEHGYAAFPVLSHATVAGIPYYELEKHYPEVPLLTADELKERVVHCAYEVLESKQGVTNAAIGQVAFELAKAIILDEKSIFSISTPFFDGVYGNDHPVAIGNPTVVGRNGWEKRFLIDLDEWETVKMAEAIESIQNNIKVAEETK